MPAPSANAGRRRGLGEASGTGNVFTTVAFSIILVYAVDDPDLSAAVIGFVLGIANVGWLLEALTAAQSTSAIRNLASLSATTIDA